MTYNDIRLQAYDRLQLASAPPTAVITRISRYVNRWHRKLLSGAGMQSLRRVQLTQASVANQFDYGIGLEEIYFITERTNDTQLAKATEGWWRSAFPDPTAFTGTPTHWVPLGFSRFTARPSNASELFVKSTSAADSTQTAYLEALRANGQRISLTVTLTGVTAVTLGAATTDIIDVVDFYLSAAAAGQVTLHEDSGTGTTLSTINIGLTYPRFLRYALAPTPSAAITYYLDGLATLVDMSNSTDEPLLPPDFHDLLVDGAVYDEWLSKGRLKDAQWLRDEIRQRQLELRNRVWMQYNQPDPGEGLVARRTFDQTLSLPIS